jgi:hypothetical protein
MRFSSRVVLKTPINVKLWREEKEKVRKGKEISDVLSVYVCLRENLLRNIDPLWAAVAQAV